MREKVSSVASSFVAYLLVLIQEGFADVTVMWALVEEMASGLARSPA